MKNIKALGRFMYKGIDDSQFIFNNPPFRKASKQSFVQWFWSAEEIIELSQ